VGPLTSFVEKDTLANTCIRLEERLQTIYIYTPTVLAVRTQTRLQLQHCCKQWSPYL
jgi:hypothetical protein